MSRKPPKSQAGEKVGYKNPPKHSQFKKGQSGNPKGRPKKKKLEDLDIGKLLNAPVDLRSDGKRKTVSTFEAVLRRKIADALKGHAPSLVWILNLLEEMKIITPPAEPQLGGVVIAPKGISPQQWVESGGFDEEMDRRWGDH